MPPRKTPTIITLFLMPLITAPDVVVAFQPHHLTAREPNTTNLIDPVTQPFCGASSCWHWYDPPPELCPVILGACPNDSDASDNGGRKCGMYQYPRDCYCALKTGLSCAFSCSWKTWWETEDWFANLCPGSPALKLDFSGLPKCAKGCLDDAIFESGCLTQTSNCFCSNGDLFGCHNNCHKDAEFKQIGTWLQDACGIPPATATAALASGTFVLSTATATAIDGLSATDTKVSPPAPAPRKPLKWDEDFIIAVLSFTVIAALGLWWQGVVVRKKPIRKRE
ncbi:hypothetical protein F5884DRAFT_56957 [Xylogone sp. PMI_703]|nr:hypothetical protein F5884DRAFT_56957 [Xylogone sp. PMI_703]